MDVITGKTRPTTGQRLPRQPAQRSDPAARVSHRPDGGGAQVPAADGVPGPHGVRELRARAARQQGRLAQPVHAHVERAARAHRRGAGDRRSQRAAPSAGRAAGARPEAMAGDRDAAGARAAGAADRRAGRRHDPTRDGAHRRAAARPRGPAHGGRRRARHAVRAQHRAQGHRAARRARCWPRGRWTRSRPTRACARSTWGRRTEKRRHRGEATCSRFRRSISSTGAATRCGTPSSPCPRAAASASWAATASARRRCSR